MRFPFMTDQEIDMPKLHAYLSFDGNCAEAMKFYCAVLDAKLEALITYGEMHGAEPLPPSDANKIMHAYLVRPEFSLMAGDAPPGTPYEGIKGVLMTLTYAAVADAKRVFGALSQGGSVQMPLADTFWAETFGMVTDRFGTPWAINGGPKPTPTA
jgi:PhnB protein